MNLVKWVLVKFQESKFCLNQTLKILKTVLILLLKTVRSEWDSKTLVLSANGIGTDLFLTY